MKIINDILPILSFIISVVAVIIARKSYIFTKDSIYSDNRPYLQLIKLYHYPKQCRIYTGEEFNTEMREMIRDTLGTISLKMEDEKKNILVINLLEDEDINYNNIVVVTDVIECTYKNLNGILSEVALIEASSKLKSSHRTICLKGEYKKYYLCINQNIEFKVSITYICNLGQETSLIYQNLQKYKERDSIDLLNNKNAMNELINFEEVCYKFKCRNNKKYTYYKEFTMTINESGANPKFRDYDIKKPRSMI